VQKQETLMPGDSSGSNDEELVSQIEQLRARMDRLMKGGTSTSNSALLTDPPKQPAQTVPSHPAVKPPPERSRIRDLIGPAEEEIVQDSASQRDAVAFPEEVSTDRTQRDRQVDDRPAPRAPTSKPRQATVDGSLIAVDGGRSDSSRPTVRSFDDLGSAVEEELARDASVPPLEPKKGPGLASRFGPADEPVVTPSDQLLEQVAEDEFEAEVLEPVEPAAAEQERRVRVAASRSPRGALVAIWGFTAITSGTIAVLHFVGAI